MTPVVEAEGVFFSYGKRAVLGGVTLRVLRGELVALVGANGAGKTTLLKVLAGVLVPNAGQIRVPSPRSRTVGYLAQSEELPIDWSAREIVQLGRLPYVGLWRDPTPKDDQAVRHAMDRTGTLHLAKRLVGTLSGGERQRVALARALAQEPRVLLLDEPTAHLDLRHQVELFAALRAEAARDVGIVVIMHDLSFAAHADRCVLLLDGKVRADGPPVDVLRPDILREVYDTDVEVLRTTDGRLVIAPAMAPSAERSSTPCQSEREKWTRIASS